jgi:hypothetical protein
MAGILYCLTSEGKLVWQLETGEALDNYHVVSPWESEVWPPSDRKAPCGYCILFSTVQVVRTPIPEVVGQLWAAAAWCGREQGSGCDDGYDGDVHGHDGDVDS